MGRSAILLAWALTSTALAAPGSARADEETSLTQAVTNPKPKEDPKKKDPKKPRKDPKPDAKPEPRPDAKPDKKPKEAKKPDPDTVPDLTDGAKPKPKRPPPDEPDGTDPAPATEPEEAPKPRKPDPEPEPERPVAEEPKKHVDDEIGAEERKPASDPERPDKPEGYSADWSAVTGTGVGEDQHLLWAELGSPGLSVRFLQGRAHGLDMGAGVELDFPPLNGSVGDTQRGLSALRLMGAIHYAAVQAAPLSMYLHFDPQWIVGFSGIGMIYLPVSVGAGLDLKAVHLGLDVGLAPFTASLHPYLPFRDFGVSPPFVGASAEFPLTDAMALTVRAQLQTFLWDATGLFHNSGASPFVFGMLNAGLAYRF
jgi:hypothetical protein